MTSTIPIDISILCTIRCGLELEEFQLWHYRVALSVYGTMEWLEQCPRESRCVSMNLNCSASVPGWWPCPVSSDQCPVSRTDHVQGVTRYSSVVLPRSELRRVTNRILINRKRTFETNLATWMILEEQTHGFYFHSLFLQILYVVFSTFWDSMEAWVVDCTDK